MKKRLLTIIEMLQSDRFSEVNAGLNRVKGLLEDEVFGKFQENVQDTYDKVRMYDCTRNHMVSVLKEVIAHVGEDGKIHCGCGCGGECGGKGCKCRER